MGQVPGFRCGCGVVPRLGWPGAASPAQPAKEAPGPVRGRLIGPVLSASAASALVLAPGAAAALPGPMLPQRHRARLPVAAPLPRPAPGGRRRSPGLRGAQPRRRRRGQVAVMRVGGQPRRGRGYTRTARGHTQASAISEVTGTRGRQRPGRSTRAATPRSTRCRAGRRATAPRAGTTGPAPAMTRRSPLPSRTASGAPPPRSRPPRR